MRWRALVFVFVWLVACGAPHGNAPARVVTIERVVTVEHVADAGVAYVAPKLAGHVTDLTEKLTAAQRRVIEDDLTLFDRSTTNEIAVLIVPSLEGHSIEEAALVTANTWKLGKRGFDNGVLVLIAVAERRVRIETGRGIEKILTDERAHDIIVTMKPALAAGDYYEAIIDALIAIEKTLR